MSAHSSRTHVFILNMCIAQPRMKHLTCLVTAWYSSETMQTFGIGTKQLKLWPCQEGRVWF